MTAQMYNNVVNQSGRIMFLALWSMVAVACAPEDSPSPGRTQLGVITTNVITTNSLQYNGFSLGCNALDGLCVARGSIADAPLHGLHVNRGDLKGLRLNGITLPGKSSPGAVVEKPGEPGAGFYGYNINGLYIDGVSPGSVSIHGLGLGGISLRGFGGSGLMINRAELNGVGINRRDGSLLGNGIAFRGVNPDLLGTADHVRAGAGLTGLAVNGLFLDGSQINSLSIGGSSLLDTALDSLAFNEPGDHGIHLVSESGAPTAMDPDQEFIAHAVLFYLVGCALPEGESAAITTSDGTTHVLPGLRGYAPEWQYGPISQAGAEKVRSCLASSIGAHENAKLTADEQSRLDTVLDHLVACALPADDEIAVVQDDGAVKTYHGRHGLAPEWASRPLHPDNEARVRACLESDPDAVFGRELNDAQEERLELVLRYAIECALADDQNVTIYGSDGAARTYHGLVGLAPEWSDGALSPSGRQRVSACLAARTNRNGQFVRLSVRGAATHTTRLERDLFPHHEGAFWGNAFLDQPYIQTCTAAGAGFSGRVCTDGSCGYQALGACAEVCATTGNDDGSFEQCARHGAVLNTYLGITATVASGKKHNCRLQPDGSLSCWGGNESGGLGDGTTLDRRSPELVTGLGTDVAEVGAGARHTCARLANGSVSCWGGNDLGQTGNTGSTEVLTSPSQVTALGNDIASLAVGRDHSCALRTDGTLLCWGSNEHGQLGSDAMSASANPRAIVELGNQVARVALGESADHSCAITLTGELWCWGRNDQGQIGDGTRGGHSGPVHIAIDGDGNPFEELTDLCTGGSHTCARDAQGRVFCWGDDGSGQQSISPLGSIEHTRPGAVALPDRAVQGGLSCASEHTCAILADGSVSCWGNNELGQLGNGTYGESDPSTVVGLELAAVAVSADADRTCVTLLDRSLWCWGHDPEDMLFPGATSNRPVAWQVVEIGKHPGSKRRS